MNAIVKTSAFRTGNSVAVRLPKAFGIKPGDSLEVKQRGHDIEIHRVSDPDEERAKVLALIRELDAIGPVPGVITNREEERIEFPDRPGLYD